MGNLEFIFNEYAALAALICNFVFCLTYTNKTLTMVSDMTLTARSCIGLAKEGMASLSLMQQFENVRKTFIFKVNVKVNV